ncbi:MAG: hypothetical protein GY832_37000 [Chloroflexi bacterium]|nr:hypothetical protein [Chloroflexota bacterium]
MKNNDQMRFSFLTNAKTMGTLGLVTGLLAIIAGAFLPGVGLALGAEATAMALLGYRQQKKESEDGKMVYVALLLGLVAIVVSIVSVLSMGGRPA